MRLLAGLQVSRKDIIGLGVGGLLMEIVTRPQPRSPPVHRGDRNVAAVVLAAGRSTRMGGPNKLLAELGGKPLVRIAVEQALASQARPVVVVTGHQREEVRGGARRACRSRSCTIPISPTGSAPRSRPGSRAVPDDADGAIVCLGDMPQDRCRPDRPPDRGLRARPGALIAMPFNDGRRGNPVVWSRRFFAELMTLEGDVGARHLIGAIPRRSPKSRSRGRAPSRHRYAGGAGPGPRRLKARRSSPCRSQSVNQVETTLPLQSAPCRPWGEGILVLSLQLGPRRRAVVAAVLSVMVVTGPVPEPPRWPPARWPSANAAPMARPSTIRPRPRRLPPREAMQGRLPDHRDHEPVLCGTRRRHGESLRLLRAGGGAAHLQRAQCRDQVLLPVRRQGMRDPGLGLRRKRLRLRQVTDFSPQISIAEAKA